MQNMTSQTNLNQFSTRANNSFGKTNMSPAGQQYELLIHALSHEHTRENIDRHALALEKWIRDYDEGFYVRDLRDIIVVLQIMRERLLSHPEIFSGILTKFLKVCSKPLFESRANERLKPECTESIRAYFKEVSKFWLVCEQKSRVEIASALRCIVNGGTDPTILKADVVKWESDGTRTQVTDKLYIQTLLREGLAIDAIVEEFEFAVNAIKKDDAVRSEYEGEVGAVDSSPAAQVAGKTVRPSNRKQDDNYGRTEAADGDGDDDDDDDFNEDGAYEAGYGSVVSGSVTGGPSVDSSLEGSSVMDENDSQVVE